MAAAAEAVGDGDAAAVVAGAAEALRGVGDECLPLVLERTAVLVELGEALHLVGDDAVGLAHRRVHLGELLGAGGDDEDRHLLHPLPAEPHDAADERRLVADDLDAVVGDDLARLADARVQEARHLELDGAVGGGEVGELGLAADGAGEAEDAAVLVEDVRRADGGEGRLGDRRLVGELVVEVRQPQRRETHLGDLLVDEDDGDALAVLVDHAVVVALDLALRLAHRLLRLVPDLRVVHLLGHQVLAALEHLEARLELRSALGVLLDVVRVGVLVDDEVVDLVDDDDGVAEDLVQLPLEHLAQEELIDPRLQAVHHLAVRVEQVVDARAALDAERLEEGLVGRKVAVEQPLVVLEDVDAEAVQLDHEDGQHRDDDRLALASRHLSDERAQVELGSREEAEEAAVARLGRLVLLHLEVVAVEARHHQHGERLRVVRRERREVARDHVPHPVLGNLLHLRHVDRHPVAARLGDELQQELGLVEEVDRRQLLRVEDAHVAVGLEGGVDEDREHLQLLLCMRHAHEVVLVLDVPAELLLGERQRLAEHVLDHVRDVGGLLEERRPFERRRLRNVPLEERLHRALAQRVALHRLEGMDAVLRNLGQQRQLDAVEEVDLERRALVELLEDHQQEVLLVVVALELLEHLARPLGDLGAVALGGTDVEPQQQVEHLGVQRA